MGPIIIKTFNDHNFNQISFCEHPPILSLLVLHLFMFHSVSITVLVVFGGTQNADTYGQ
jgi:hypothetical protein